MGTSVWVFSRGVFFPPKTLTSLDCRCATVATFAALYVSRRDENTLAARQKHDRSDDDDDRVLRVCERRKRDETRGD